MTHQSLIATTPYRPETRSRDDIRAAGAAAELYVPGDAQDMNPRFRHGFRLLLLMLHQKIAQPGALRFTKSLFAFLRGLHQSETRAMKDWLIESLRASPLWQARVLFDLGGRKALQKWQTRFDQSAWRRPNTNPRRGERRKTQDGTPPKPRYRMDRDGLFRWAKISQVEPTAGKCGTTINIGAEHCARDPRRNPSLSKNPWPIEVTADDFKLCANIVIDDTHHAEDVKTLWSNIQSEHLDWHRQLVSLYDFITLGARGLLAPVTVVFAPP